MESNYKGRGLNRASIPPPFYCECSPLQICVYHRYRHKYSILRCFIFGKFLLHVFCSFCLFSVAIIVDSCIRVEKNILKIILK